MTQERYWYQDGGNVLTILLVSAFAAFLLYGCYRNEQENAKPRVVPKIAGQLQQPLFGSPSLTITVWHQHPGILRNGQLQVTLNDDPARSKERWQRQYHSFESWEPNKDHAVTFTFPLREYQPHNEIQLGFLLAGRDIKPYISSGEWLGKGWKSDQDSEQPASK